MKGLAAALVPLLCAVMVATGCAAAAGPGDLVGRTFLSTGVTDAGADRPLVPGTQIRLTFQDGTNLGASAGCNSMGGTYRVADRVLVFEGGGMTDMGCDEPRHAQDEWVSRFLASRPTVALNGNELVLTSGEVVVRLLDQEVATPDLPLVGPVWRVDTIIDGDVAMGFGGPVAATMHFHPDGTVTLHTGCNEGGASVTSDGTTLRFGNIALTKRACEGPAAQVEEGVLALLAADAVTYRITADGLMLNGGDRGLGLRGR